MDILFDLLRGRIEDRFVRMLKASLAPLPVYLRRLGIGLLLILVSVIGWSGMFTALVVACFFALAHLSAYAIAALWTALVAAVIGIILLSIGINLLRKPR